MTNDFRCTSNEMAISKCHMCVPRGVGYTSEKSLATHKNIIEAIVTQDIKYTIKTNQLNNRLNMSDFKLKVIDFDQIFFR